MRPEIVAHAVTKYGRTDVLLEHAEDGGAFFVREHVEHRFGVFGRTNGKFDGTRAVQPVHGKGGSTGGTKGIPALPFWLPGVHRQHFHKGRERFVQPQSVPPGHRDQIPEPQCAFACAVRCPAPAKLATVGAGSLIDEQRSLPEGDGAKVFHGS